MTARQARRNANLAGRRSLSAVAQTGPEHNSHCRKRRSDTIGFVSRSGASRRCRAPGLAGGGVFGPAGWYLLRWMRGKLGLFGETSRSNDSADDFPAPRSSLYTSANWLCFVKPPCWSIRHNSFCIKDLLLLSPWWKLGLFGTIGSGDAGVPPRTLRRRSAWLAGNWLCFARLLPDGW